MHDKFIDALRRGQIKGHTRIITEDIRTRRREIVEDDNMMTAALDKIFAANMLGMMDFDNLMPLTKMIGGVFLFADPLTENSGNTWAPNSSNNRLVGHAGQTSHSSGSTTRGNPNGAATEYDRANGFVKFVWDWTLEQANGTISAVSLTSASAGDCGLYPDGTFALLEPHGVMKTDVTNVSSYTIGGTYNELYSSRCPVAIDADGNGLSLILSGDQFTENVVRHPYVRPCLIEKPSIVSADDYTIVSTRTATLSRSFTSGYSQIGQDDANYYVMERDASTNTRLYIDIVSKSDFSVTSKTIDIVGATLARPALNMSGVNNGIISGGFVYWVSGSDAKTFVRIEIDTPANVTVLTSSLSSNISLRAQPISGSDGLILGRNFLINGDNVYPVAVRSTRASDEYINEYETMAKYNNGPLLFECNSFSDTASYRKVCAGGMLYLPYLASINNLQTPVQKNINKTMRVEYTVTLSSGGS